MKHDFKAHIELIIAKAERFGREFVDPYTIEALCFSFVIPIIEYGSKEWNTYHKGKKRGIDRFRENFFFMR